MLLISNVHEREYPVPADELGALLDDLGGPGDRLWPKGWPQLRLDRPMAEGAAGGHGPIRYAVSRFEPGRYAEFRFAPTMDMDGSHSLTVLAGDRPGTSVLRHSLIGTPSGSMRLVWPVAIRWLHDALIEDLLDRAGTELGHPPATPSRHSWWVQLLRIGLAAMPGPAPKRQLEAA